MAKKNNRCPAINGKGHQILACLNQDYSEWISELVEELMAHPEGKYTLKLLKRYA